MGRQPCCDKVGLKKGPWTADEDRKLITFILTNGISCWRTLPKLAGLMRCGKSCRLRWINYLRPDLKRGLLSEYEENMVINLHSQLGNKWSKIASHLPGRTDNEIKNHWNTHIKKKLRKNGIDPVTHTPLPPHPTEKSQEHENQNSSNMDQNRRTEKCTDSITIQQDEMQSMLEAPTLDVINNGFCTDEVPLIESHEILFSDSSMHYNSSSSTTTTSSNTNIDSLLEDLEFLATSDWLNGVDSTTNNIGFSWDMDDDFSNSNFLINDIGYGRYNPPAVHDFYDFSRLVLGEEYGKFELLRGD